MEIVVEGSAAFVPERCMSNEDFTAFLDTSDSWIRSRTGIVSRHISESGSTVELAVEAARRLFAETTAVAASELDLIIVATSSPDEMFPACACRVQAAIGASSALAFDLSAACAGFIFALQTAQAYLLSGKARHALLIGAECMSKLLDWNDRSTCVLFGDAAGAVLLSARASAQEYTDELSGGGLAAQGQPAEQSYGGLTGLSHAADMGCGVQMAGAPPANEGGCNKPRLRAVCCASDGRGAEQLRCPAPFGTVGERMSMNGQEVFRFAVRAVPEIIERMLSRLGKLRFADEADMSVRANIAGVANTDAGADRAAKLDAGVSDDTAAASLGVDDIDLYLLHQANVRIIEAIAHRMKQPVEKFPTNLADYGNTSAASIPLLLDEVLRGCKFERGMRVALAGFGAGLSYGAALLEF